MPTYIVRDTTVMVHSHPRMKRYIGVPVTVHVDEKSHQVTVDEVTLDGNPVKVEKTMAFHDADIKYDPDDGVARIERNAT